MPGDKRCFFSRRMANTAVLLNGFQCGDRTIKVGRERRKAPS